MIRFARLLAASAIGTGIGIGLVLCLSLTPLLRPSAGASPNTVGPVSLITTDWCAQQHTNDPNVQAYIDLQCAVHSALFDDGEQPGAAYRFDDFVAAPGFYEGVNYAEQEVLLEAVYIIEADLENEAPDLFAEGVEVHLVIANMHGSAGEIAVAGTMLYMPLEQAYRAFSVNSLLTGPEMAVYSHAAALAEGAMVHEENEGFGPTTPAYPLSTATSLPENLWAYESDLSVLYGDGPQTVDPACVQAAYDKYNDAVKAAEDDRAECEAIAFAGFVACMAACTVAGYLCIGTLIFCIVGVPCVFACQWALIADANNCNAAFANALNAAAATLAADLLACGVVIVQD